MNFGSNKPVMEINMRIISLDGGGSERRPACRAINIVSHMCLLFGNSGSLKFLEHWWPVLACIGRLLPFTLDASCDS
jgi:hypothetical protein